MALVMVLLCVRRGLNQIVVGIGLTLACEGLNAILHHFQFSRTYPRLDAAEATEIPLLSSIPILGPALFKHHLVVLPRGADVGVMVYIYQRTQLGLNLQAAGDKPAALDVAGVDVLKTRTIAVLTTGAMAGLGGAYLANIGAGIFVPYITNGAGFLGIVLAMLARGRPPLGADRRLALRRLPVAHHCDAGRRHQHADRRHPDAALHRRHDDADTLRAAGPACPRRLGYPINAARAETRRNTGGRCV